MDSSLKSVPSVSLDKFIIKYIPFLFVFFFVWLARVIWIGLYAVDVPFWDQWDAQANELFLPLLRGDFEMSRLFAQHNEHRIFFTRVLSISLFKILGYWNTLFEMQVQAMIPAFTAGVLAYMFSLKKHSVLLTLGIALYFAAPLGTENLFLGMESNFYFMILFSLLAMNFFSKIDKSKLNIFLTFLFSIAAYFTLSSGAIVSIVIAFLCFIRLVYSKVSSKKLILSLSLIFILIFFIEIITIKAVPGHQGLRANSVNAFLNGLKLYLAWPIFKDVCFGYLFHFSGLSLLTFIIFYKRDKLEDPIFFSFFSFLIWVYAQILILVYARGGEGNVPDIANRYLDILSLLPIFILYLVTALFENQKQKSRYMEIAFLLLCIFFFIRVVKYGHIERVKLYLEKEHMLAVLIKAKQMEINLPGSSLPYLKARGPAIDLPYPDPIKLHKIMNDPFFDIIYPKLRLLYRKD